jgi:hypothetical protein
MKIAIMASQMHPRTVIAPDVLWVALCKRLSRPPFTNEQSFGGNIQVTAQLV